MMKVHKGVTEFTITKDEEEMILDKVQDCTAKSWDDVEKKTEDIIKKLK
jgi:hypothetical protein